MFLQNNTVCGSILFKNYIGLVIEPVQAVPSGNKIYKFIKEVNILGIRICPRATDPNEPPECEQRRIDLSNESPIDLANGFRIFFSNQLTSGTVALTPAFCDNLTADAAFDTPTVEDLENPFVQAELESRGICPMVVWAINNGEPTLVRLEPGSVQPVIILPTPSESCLAYTICIDNLQ